ncbi:baseplate hub domain-containing protein [Acinetobacter sp. ANC 5383]
MLGFGLFTRRELYTLVRGSETFRYSSGDKDVTVGNVTWKKLAIKRGQISSSSDLEKNTLEVTFAADSEFAQSCLRSALEEVVFLTLSKYQSGTVSLLWQGRLTGVKPDAATIVLTFENDYTSLARVGARYKYQRTCAHDLYGTGCKLNKDNWKVRTTLVSVSGSAVALRGLESYADSYFRLGMLENSNSVNVGIEASSGNSITLIRRLDSLADYLTTDEALQALADATTALSTAESSLATAQENFDAAVVDRDALDPSIPTYADDYAAAQAIVHQKQIDLDVALAAKVTAQASYDTATANVHYVYVYPGCMKSLTACDGFGNTDNFMGFSFIPEDNPTTTRII